MESGAVSSSQLYASLPSDVLLKLFETSAVLIIAGVPPGTEFGIDETNYLVGEDFRGVKLIPEGVHFVYCASRGPYGDSAPRVGFAHFFKRSEIIIREWDNEREELRERIQEGEKEKIRENLRTLDRFLAPYDCTGLLKWKNLTANVTLDTVLKHSPACGLVRNSIELLSCSDEDRPRGDKPSDIPRLTRIRSLMNEEELLPNLKSIPGTIPNFTDLPPRCPKNASPSEISQHYMDSITAVKQVLTNRESAILAEIQFTFILFHCGHSIESLNHWRKLLLLLSNSESAPAMFRTFYTNYLTALQYQLPELPIELMEQSKFNTVYCDVKSLLLNCYQAGITSAAQSLEKTLRETLLWRFEDLFAEDPEDLPTVVDL